MAEAETPVAADAPAAKSPTQPSYISEVRARMYGAGQKQGHPLAKASQVVLIDPDSPTSRALQMMKLPRERVDDAMILLVDGALAPERKPRDLPENSLNIWDADTGTRLMWLRGHLEWAVDGGIVDVMKGIATVLWSMLTRFNRRRVQREAANEEHSGDDEEGGY